MATFITEQVSAMRFDVAKGSQHLSHDSIHPCTHVHRLGRQPDFINTDHLSQTLDQKAVIQLLIFHRPVDFDHLIPLRNLVPM